jgi:hypothetical protein
MASEFSKVTRTLWRRSKKFKSLTNSDWKLLYLYLLTSEHFNPVGCYTLAQGYACADLGWLEKRYLDGIEALISVGLIEYDFANDTIFIVNSVEHNAPANAKHAMGMLIDLQNAESELLKYKRFQELRDVFQRKGIDRDKLSGNDLRALYIRFPNPIDITKNVEPREELEPREEPRTVGSGSARAANGSAAAPDGAASPSPNLVTEENLPLHVTTRSLPPEIQNKIAELKTAGANR